MKDHMADQILDFFQEVYPNIGSALSLHERCQQDKIWKTREGEIIKLDEMSLSHAQNLIRWLEHRANAIKTAGEAWWAYEVYNHNGGDQAHYSLEQTEYEIVQMSAIQYLRGMPLYEKLNEITSEPSPP